jgi:hypothetical protein
LATDPAFRIQANNFFGRAERYKEYLGGSAPGSVEESGDRPLMTETQRFLAGEETQ